MRNINPSGLLQAFTMSDLFDLSDDIRADSCQTATQNTSGAFAAFRLHVAKMWRGATATSRWSNKLDNLVSATVYCRLTALLPRCFWAVGNTSWRILLNWNSTRCWLNVKDVILEVTHHFRNFWRRHTSNKDKEIERNRIFSEEWSIREYAEELMVGRNSQWKMVRNTRLVRVKGTRKQHGDI